MNVLVIDDNATLRADLRRSIQELRWSAHEADSLEAALVHLDGLEIDAVVVDHTIGATGGLEVARELRARGFTGAILMFSALVDPAVRATAANLGVRQVSKVDRRAVLRMLRALSQQGSRAPN